LLLERKSQDRSFSLWSGHGEATDGLPTPVIPGETPANKR
jgi:hypothetical protein